MGFETLLSLMPQPRLKNAALYQQKGQIRLFGFTLASCDFIEYLKIFQI